MECNKDEAARAKEIAEKKFAANDLQGAKKFALKAQALFPGLEGIAHMVATMDIYLASKVKFDGEKDWYSILSVAITADDETLKKQYRKLLLQLHPDKNKSVGAEGAFQMVQEAYAVLSDKAKRAAYNQKRNIRAFQQSTSQSNKASVAPDAANGFYNFATAAAASKASANRQKAGVATRPVHPRPTQPPPPPPRPSPPSPHFTPFKPAPASTPARVRVPPPAPSPTFWTSCNKCKMNYEYLRVYLDHHLRCPSCREPFLAKEVPMPPTENVVQHSSIHGTNKNASSTRNFQWGSFSRATGAASATAASATAAQAANVVHQTYEKVRREREEAQATARKEEALRRKYNPLKRHTNMSENVNLGTGDVASSKKMRTLGKDAGVGVSAFIPGPGANCFTMPGEKISFCADAGAYQFQGFNGRSSWKPVPPVCTSLTRTFNQLDCRSILLEKAKSDLKNKLKELRNGTSQVAASGIGGKEQVMEIDREDEILATNAHVDPEENNSGDGTDAENEGEDPLSYNVPDSDFHDFDMDRSEESFQSDQIWATYDDEDGMPRYYALIREVLSLKPFKLKMSFLTSRTNSEFGPMNWASAGFTKTCGDFRIGKCENNDVLNMFSHRMKWEKGQRGVIKIYPDKGDIWAVYRNWSPDWSDDTPDNVLHAYDVVEVLNDYDEGHGISVVPLAKVAGFQTVFQRNQDPNAAKKIPKEEMFRFSHQVPFYRMSGEEAPNVPKDSYELDPAALSKELLQDTTETVKEANGTLNAD
jgi:curved DNA-binding protein CbpA